MAMEVAKSCALGLFLHILCFNMGTLVNLMLFAQLVAHVFDTRGVDYELNEP